MVLTRQAIERGGCICAGRAVWALVPRGLQSRPDAVSTQCLREAGGPSPAPPLGRSAKPAFISILHPVECGHLGFRAPFFEKRNQLFGELADSRTSEKQEDEPEASSEEGLKNTQKKQKKNPPGTYSKYTQCQHEVLPMAISRGNMSKKINICEPILISVNKW